MSSTLSRLAMLASTAGVIAGSTTIVAFRHAADPVRTPASPADGHTMHMLAAHVVEGRLTGPWHHYCKVISSEPVIECLVYLTADSSARLAQIEYMVSRQITRTDLITLRDWNRNWHDHAGVITSGKVQLFDLTPDAARSATAQVEATDGIIFHLWGTEDAVPGGTVHIGQSASHVDITEREKFLFPRPPIGR